MKLKRFIEAQQDIYPRVVQELEEGQKKTHWMWFIFPQISGLGSSPTARYYAIEDIDEAKLYLEHETLGPRLKECCRLVLKNRDKSADSIFGYPDNLKLKSSMTLFAQVSEDPIFLEVLNEFYDGELDKRTIELLQAS